MKSDAPANPADAGQSNELAEPEDACCYSVTKYCWVSHYQKYFDVTTAKVWERIFKAILPFSWAPIFDSPRVDLYGPFWIMCTLIIVTCIVSQFTEYVDSFFTNADEVSKFDIERVASCASLMFTYFIFVPLFIHIIFKCSTVRKKGSPGFIWFLAVYGYSFTIFIPASIAYMVPLSLARWVILVTAGLISLFFICKELISAATQNLTGQKVKLVALVLACLHGGLVILLRYKYFG